MPTPTQRPIRRSSPVTQLGVAAMLAVFLVPLALVPNSGAGEASSSSTHAASTTDGETATATFAMYCYWTGEATLGRVDGVVASRIGHWGGREIVQVDYDPTQTNLGTLVDALRRQRSFDAVMVGKDDSQPAVEVQERQIVHLSGTPHFIEPKHSLRTRYPDLWALGLDEAQAIALNSWSYFGGPMPDVLTEEQRRRLGR